MIKIGVTGGIGSGKTTVCKIFEEKGAYVLDADRVAKEIILKENKIRKAIENTFNIEILKNGYLDTKALARVAFSNKRNQELINKIVHPEVIKQIDIKMEEMKDKTKLFVADIPLLFEAGIQEKFNYTILVVANLELRVERALKRRKLTRNDILKRAQLQMTDEEKMKLADFIIENNGTIKELRQKVDSLYEMLLNQQ